MCRWMGRLARGSKDSETGCGRCVGIRRPGEESLRRESWDWLCHVVRGG